MTEYNFQHSLTKLQLKPKNEIEKNVLEIIGEKTMSLDEIIRTSKKPAEKVVSCLMDMELEDKIKNLGNNRFSLT